MKARIGCIFTGVLLFASASLIYAQQETNQSQQNETTINRCARLLASHSLGREALVPMDRPDQSVVDEIKQHRACEISYRFNKGQDKILTATPEEIKEDFERFKYLFTYYDNLSALEKKQLRSFPEPQDDKTEAGKQSNLDRQVDVLLFKEGHDGLSVRDILRLESLSHELDREQVALYGRLLLIQSLRLNRRYQEAAHMFKQMRKGLEIKEHKLDYGDENTYFNKQTLRNLIAVNGYAAYAQVRGTLKSDGEIIADYLDNREALTSLIGIEWPAIKPGNPDGLLLKLTDASKIGLDTPQWDSEHRLAHVVGSFAEGDNTIGFIQGKELHAISLPALDEPEVMDAPLAAEKLQAFYKREVQTNSTPDMRLFTVLKYVDGSYDIQLGDQSLTITSEDNQSLLEGRALPPSHPLTAALTKDGVPRVLYANPLMQYTGDALRDADSFVFALQKSYPDVAIYRDPFTAETSEKVKALHAFTIAGPSDVTAIVAGDSFRPKVDDFGVIKAIENDLEQAHVKVVEVKDGEPLRWNKADSGRALIVITAHSNAALRVFVEKVGQAGAFEGNFVLFNACGTELTRSLVNEINARYKSAATFAHSGTITPGALKASMPELLGVLGNGDKIEFGKLLIKTFNAHQLNGVWTISQLVDRVQGGGGE